MAWREGMLLWLTRDHVIPIRVLTFVALIHNARSDASGELAPAKDGPCHVGKFSGTSLNTHEKGCFPCPSGNYGAGNTVCEACAIGRYQKVMIPAHDYRFAHASDNVCCFRHFVVLWEDELRGLSKERPGCPGASALSGVRQGFVP